MEISIQFIYFYLQPNKRFFLFSTTQYILQFSLCFSLATQWIENWSFCGLSFKLEQLFQSCQVYPLEFRINQIIEIAWECSSSVVQLYVEGTNATSLYGSESVLAWGSKKWMKFRSFSGQNKRTEISDVIQCQWKNAWNWFQLSRIQRMGLISVCSMASVR